MYNVSIMQSGKKNLLNVSKNICDLTVDPVRFVKGVNKQGLMWFPLIPCLKIQQ